MVYCRSSWVRITMAYLPDIVRAYGIKEYSVDRRTPDLTPQQQAQIGFNMQRKDIVMQGLARDVQRNVVSNRFNTQPAVVQQAQEQQSRRATVRQGQLEMTARRLRKRLTDAYGVSENTTFLEHRLTTFGSPIITNIPPTADILETLRDVQGGVTGANERLLRLITPVERHVVQQPQPLEEESSGLLDVGGAVQAGVASGAGSQLVQGSSDGRRLSPAEIIRRQQQADDDGGFSLASLYGSAARSATSAFLSVNNTLTEAAADLVETLGLSQDWADLLRTAQIDEITNDTDITNSLLGTDFVDNLLKRQLLDLDDSEREGIYPLGKSTYIRGVGAVTGEVLIGGLEATDVFAIRGIGRAGLRHIAGRTSGSSRTGRTIDRGFDAATGEGLGLESVAQRLGEDEGAVSLDLLTGGILGRTPRPGQQTTLLVPVAPTLLGNLRHMGARNAIHKSLAVNTDPVSIKQTLIDNGVGIIIENHRIDDLARKISGMSNPDEIGNFIANAQVDRVKHIPPQQLDRNLQYVYNIDRALTGGLFSEQDAITQNTARAISNSRLSQEALRQTNVPTALRPIVNFAGTEFPVRADFEEYVSKTGVERFLDVFRNDLLLNNSRSLYNSLAITQLELERQQIAARITRSLFQKSRQTRREVDSFLRQQSDVLTADEFNAGLGEAIRPFAKNLGLTDQETVVIINNFQEHLNKTNQINDLIEGSTRRDTTVINEFNDVLAGLGNTPQEQIEKIYDLVEEVVRVQSVLPEVETFGRNYFIKDGGVSKIADLMGENIGKAFRNLRANVTEVTQNRLIAEANAMYTAMRQLGLEVLPDHMNPYHHAQALRSLLSADIDNLTETASKIADNEFNLFNNFNNNIPQGTSKISFDDFANDVNEYLWARRAPEYNGNLNEPKAAGITDNEAEEIVSNLAEKYGDDYFKEMANELYAFNRETISFIRDSGFKDDVELATILNASDRYVPLRRDIKDQREFIGDLMGTPGDIIRAAKGSEKRVIDIVGASIQMRALAIVQKQLNEIGSRLDELLTAGDGILEDQIKIVARGVGDKGWRKNYKGKENYYSYFKDGKRVVFNVSDPMLQRALRTVPQHEIGAAMHAIATITKFQAANFTTLNASFAQANLARDIIGGFANASATHGYLASIEMLSRAPVSAVALALPRSAARVPVLGRLYTQAELFKSSGGQIGGVINDLRRQNQNIISKEYNDIISAQKPGTRAKVLKTRNALANVMYGVTGYYENINRFSLQQITLRQGGTIEQARQASLDATVNFLNRGTGLAGRTVRIPRSNLPVLRSIPEIQYTFPEVIRGAGFGYAFLNAAIQGGFDKLVRTASHPRGLAAYIALGYGAAKLENEFNLDLNPFWDRELEVARPYFYKRYANFLTDEEGNYFRVPISHEAAIFLEFGRMMVDLQTGRATPDETLRRLKRMPEFAGGTLNPLSGHGRQALVPTVGQPFTQSSTNIAWHGGRISPKNFSHTGIPEDNVFNIQKANNETEWLLAREIAKIYNRIDPHNTLPLLNTAGRAKVFTDSFGGGLLDSITIGFDTVRQIFGEEIIRSEKPIDDIAITQFLFKAFQGEHPPEETITRAALENIYQDEIRNNAIDYYQAKNRGDTEAARDAIDNIIDFRLSGRVNDKDNNQFIANQFLIAQGFRELAPIFNRDIGTVSPPEMDVAEDGTIESVPTVMEWYLYNRMSGYYADRQGAWEAAVESYEQYLMSMNEYNQNGYQAPQF